jgi:ABC-2 type transport system permease protein
MNALVPHTTQTAELPAVATEGWLFWQLRTTIFRAIFTEAIRTARLRTALLLILSSFFWVGLFWLFLEGFQFLEIGITQPSMRAQIVQAIFNTFFFTLTFMIGVSSAIVMYGSLYRSPETSMLLTLPIRAERIVLYKYQETMMISCWGFLLLGTPLLIAYGIVNSAPWFYYVILLPFMFTFVMIPCSLGAIACLLISYIMPEMRRKIMFVAGVATLILMGWLIWQAYGAAAQHRLTPVWVRDMLTRLQFTEQRLLPSWWLSTGLLNAAHFSTSEDAASAFDAPWLLATLTSNALLLQIVLVHVAQRWFRTSFSRLQGLLPSQRAAKPIWLDRILAACFTPFPPVARAIMLKDIRLFRRDPVLWAQVLIFFGLLSLYVGSLHRFELASSFTPWIVVMSYMNVAVIALIYSTFATRFILPMISLEGRAFWVLGTAPISRETVITSKYFLSSTLSIPPCLALIIASDCMLPIASMYPPIVIAHAVTIVFLCSTLSALAVGNGARFPNLRENSPSRIASGFGGTLNLVESGLLILSVSFLNGVPGYFWVQAAEGSYSIRPGSFALGTLPPVVLCLVISVFLCILVTAYALRMGQRAFRNLQN